MPTRLGHFCGGLGISMGAQVTYDSETESHLPAGSKEGPGIVEKMRIEYTQPPKLFQS
jgi:hypothetical protein